MIKKLSILFLMVFSIYSCDEYPPTALSITRGKLPGVNPTNSSELQFDVTFSEEVLNVSISDFLLTTISGTVSGSIYDISSQDNINYTIHINEVKGNGEIRLDLYDDDDSIVDKQGDPLSTKTYIIGETYNVDHTGISVLTINRGHLPSKNPTNSTNLEFDVTFDSSVATSVIAGDFLLTNTGLGTPSIIGVTGGPIVYRVTVDTKGIEGDIGLDFADFDGTVQDSVGNSASPTSHTSDELWTVNTLGPTIVDIRRTSPGPTDSTYLEWEATFNDYIAGGSIATSDFSLTTISGNFSVGKIVSFSTKGKTLIVGVNVIGSGEIRLDFNDWDQSITDIFGNSIISTSRVGDESYWVNQP